MARIFCTSGSSVAMPVLRSFSVRPQSQLFAAGAGFHFLERRFALLEERPHLVAREVFQRRGHPLLERRIPLALRRGVLLHVLDRLPVVIDGVAGRRVAQLRQQRILQGAAPAAAGCAGSAVWNGHRRPGPRRRPAGPGRMQRGRASSVASPRGGDIIVGTSIHTSACWRCRPAGRGRAWRTGRPGRRPGGSRTACRSRGPSGIGDVFDVVEGRRQLAVVSGGVEADGLHAPQRRHAPVDPRPRREHLLHVGE